MPSIPVLTAGQKPFKSFFAEAKGRRLEGFSGAPTSPRGGGKNPACLRSRATAEDRVSGFGAGEASVGLKKMHSVIFYYLFLKKVVEEKAFSARRLELHSKLWLSPFIPFLFRPRGGAQEPLRSIQSLSAFRRAGSVFYDR